MQSPPAKAEATSVTVPRVRPSRRAAEVKVNDVPQAQVLGEGGRKEQSGDHHGGRQRHADAVGKTVAASIGCSLFPGGFLFQNHYPRFRGAP